MTICSISYHIWSVENSLRFKIRNPQPRGYGHKWSSTRLHSISCKKITIRNLCRRLQDQKTNPHKKTCLSESQSHLKFSSELDKEKIFRKIFDDVLNTDYTYTCDDAIGAMENVRKDTELLLTFNTIERRMKKHCTCLILIMLQHSFSYLR